MKILVTGAAGFIGSKTAMMLAERGDEVIGVDNINEYYDVRLKYGRLCESTIMEKRQFAKINNVINDIKIYT
jgi:UDP-glucuronate 4-epimerase